MCSRGIANDNHEQEGKHDASRLKFSASFDNIPKLPSDTPGSRKGQRPLGIYIILYTLAVVEQAWEHALCWY